MLSMPEMKGAASQKIPYILSPSAPYPLITPFIGVITPFISGKGPTL